MRKTRWRGCATEAGLGIGFPYFPVFGLSAARLGLPPPDLLVLGGTWLFGDSFDCSGFTSQDYPSEFSMTSMLNYCGVTDEGCASLASALRSNPSHLRQLDLIGNKVGDLGINRLVAGLEDPHCKLEKLWLRDCGITDEGCAALASALRSNPSHLRQLDLTGNKLGNSGVKLLFDLKDDPRYKLETLDFCEYIII
ncbi:hypothetical protein cypCar_00021252 [Cyprinus carpio]|nr:hypothetical protein cypCar_00021252 [Cyprinus carpio]